MVNVTTGTSTSNHGDAELLLFGRLGWVCSHPDPLADWRAVRVVGRVGDVYSHLIFKTYCETERYSLIAVLYTLEVLDVNPEKFICLGSG